MLSDDARARLSLLLPSTAFQGYQPTIEPTHPSRPGANSDAMDVDSTNGFRCVDTLDPSVFQDNHFLAAAHTFQDHIFTGWMAEEHLQTLAKFESGILDGSLHAPWKDEVWERDQDAGGDLRTNASLPGSQNEYSALAGYVSLWGQCNLS